MFSNQMRGQKGFAFGRKILIKTSSVWHLCPLIHGEKLFKKKEDEEVAVGIDSPT